MVLKVGSMIVTYQVNAVHDEYFTQAEEYSDEQKLKAEARATELASIRSIEGPVTLEKITREIVLITKE